MIRRLWRFVTPLVAIASLAQVPLARANTLAVGASGAPDVFPAITGPVLAVDPGVYLASTKLAGVFTEFVVFDTATSGLDFVYQFKETGGSQSVERITTDGYAGFLTDVGYAPTLSSLPNPYGAGTVIPSNVARSAVDGDIVSFGLLLGNGAATQLLVIKTNARNYTINDTSVQDGVTANAVPFTYGPAAVPLPATANMGLVLLGSLGGLWGDSSDEVEEGM